MQDREPQLAVVRASGYYDVIVLFPFALPVVSAWLFPWLDRLNGALGLPGSIPEITSMGLLFVNMMATLAILYSVARIRDPNRFLGTYDAIARLLMGSLLGIYLIFYGIAAVFWVFFVAEFVWAIAQYAAVARSPRRSFT